MMGGGPGAAPQVLAGRATNGRYAANAMPSVPGWQDLLLSSPAAGLADPGTMGVTTGSGGRPTVNAQAVASWSDPTNRSLAGPRAERSDRLFERGLSSAEAAARLAPVRPECAAAAVRLPLWRRVAAQLRDPLVLVLLAAAVLTIATGDWTDAAVILLVIVVNTTAGVVQEVKADRAITALSQLTAPEARVIRDGTQRQIPAAEVVVGDLLVLAEGDIVPADARVRRSGGAAGRRGRADRRVGPGGQESAAGGPGRPGGRGVGGHRGGPRPRPGGRDRHRRRPARWAGSPRCMATGAGADPAAAAPGRRGPGRWPAAAVVLCAIVLALGPGPRPAARADGHHRDQPGRRRRPGVAARRGHPRRWPWAPGGWPPATP